MAHAVLQREMRALKERQVRLERLFYSLLGPEMGGDEDIRPSYIRKIQRISKRMKQGKGSTTIHTHRELKKFLSGF